MLHKRRKELVTVEVIEQNDTKSAIKLVCEYGDKLRDGTEKKNTPRCKLQGINLKRNKKKQNKKNSLRLLAESNF